MGYLYCRGTRLWIGYNGADGKPRQRSTGFCVGDEAKARQVLELVEARVAAERETGRVVKSPGPVTLKAYAEHWCKARQKRGVLTATDDGSRLRLHVYPQIGHLRLHTIRPRHIRDLIRTLRAESRLAPRSIRHVYGTLHTLFNDAVVDELVEASPCVLKRGDLPRCMDRNPVWRVGAFFSREELAVLMASPEIPEDRRVLYALQGLAGLRFGEAAALRWEHYEPSTRPLGRMVVATSYNTTKRREKPVKTERPRVVPVHPFLAEILGGWREGGWSRMMARTATRGDLVVPAPDGAHRSRHHGFKRLCYDLQRLEMRHRRQHDLRRTFISLARADGARKDVLERITHGGRGSIIDQYTEFPWERLCDEVEKLAIESARAESRDGSDRGSQSAPAVVGQPPLQAASSSPSRC